MFVVTTYMIRSARFWRSQGEDWYVRDACVTPCWGDEHHPRFL